jgi:hypothetical protein
MTIFTLDTSGAVGPVPGYPNSGPVEHGCKFIWRDLTPFQQGYVEALFASVMPPRTVNPSFASGFSDLSPEALALILRDCERWQEQFPAVGKHKDGAAFWELRTKQYVKRPDFPPLTVSLSDEGKVQLRAVAGTT